MSEKTKISGTELLYDPIFAEKPDIELKGGKNLGFKILFVVVIVLFVGISIYLSFNSLSADKYIYKENDSGYTLYQFNGMDKDVCLFADSVRDENGAVQSGKNVTKVREFATTCNEYIRFIFVGKDVSELEPHCFYYAKNLLAVIVDPANEYYKSVDGVLYSRDMTEIILHPVRNDEYRLMLSLGTAAPSDKESAENFLTVFSSVTGDNPEKRSADIAGKLSAFSHYDIPAGVTSVAASCFSDCESLKYVKIPSSVTVIGDLAFFKCRGFETIVIPDSVVSIGSDAFSYCEKVSYIFVPAGVKTIGHHAFFGCLGCDAVYMGAQNGSSVDTGEAWLPKKSNRTLKEVDVFYGQERRGN